MRLVTTLAIVVATVFELMAQPPSYKEVREIVEKNNPSDETPVAERIFVCYNYGESFIVRFREGLTLREIIDKSTRKGKWVDVTVLRAGQSAQTGNRDAFSEDLKPTDNPQFSIRRHDVILLREPYTPES